MYCIHIIFIYIYIYILCLCMQIAEYMVYKYVSYIYIYIYMYVLYPASMAGSMFQSLQHSWRSRPPSKEAICVFFPADFHLGGGGLGVTQYDPLKFPKHGHFLWMGRKVLGCIYPFLWGCKRSPLGACWWVHMGDKFTSQTLGEGVIPDIPADLSGTCGSSWRTFLGCCCYHILAERYSQGKIGGNSCKKLRELTH